MVARKKVSVIGAGNVGASVAHWLAQKQLADVVMLDIVEGLAAGKALDLQESAPIAGFTTSVRGTDSYADTADSDIVVITSGLPRKPGMSRDDLLKTNAAIVKAVTTEVATTSPQAILIVVSNPLDVMVHVAGKVSGFDVKRVMGMAGALDSARYRTFIAQALHVAPTDVSALLLGGHGDDMVPLPRYSSVAGIPVTELLDPRQITQIVDRTRNGGAEVVNLLKTGGAYYAPGAGVAQMVEAILADQKRILPCCVYCDKEYRVGGAWVGVPTVVGVQGAEKIIELALTAEEKSLFDKSVAHVRQLVALVEKMAL